MSAQEVLSLHLPPFPFAPLGPLGPLVTGRLWPSDTRLALKAKGHGYAPLGSTEGWGVEPPQFSAGGPRGLGVYPVTCQIIIVAPHRCMANASAF